MEHEAAKLIGAPPGYVGHRETQPLFTQAKLNAIVSEKSKISIVLFDEIEKAHSGVWRAILGILDKAQLRLGDNTIVNFESSIVFLSSNVGAKEIGNILEPGFGFHESRPVNEITDAQQRAIEKIGLGAMSKKFPPEFANRVDEIITYRSLDRDMLAKITKIELTKIKTHIHDRLENASFAFTYENDTVDFLTTAGTSIKYGARELKRTLGRFILNPLADDFVDGKISSGSLVKCKVVDDHIEWDITEAPTEMTPEENEELAAVAPAGTTKKTRRAKSTG
jgi:ATP-dependent Clp protease ATP-binding subunit ClpA